jgi:thiamine-monophosphate kinase
MPNEFDFIAWIRTQSPATAAVPIPPGDDLAALKWEAMDLLLVGVDQVLDGVHFDSIVHSPHDIGLKAMNRNLSDCAAMACLPTAALASVALPKGSGVDYACELYKGLRAAADPFDCVIVGGDTGSWQGKLAMSVTILGRSAGIAPVTRSGARPGDRLYVTGPLGGSLLGRHMHFSPRVHLARELAARGRVTAMIDLSDGLARDLRHICHESGVGAIVDADCIPIHDDARQLASQHGVDPLTHAIGDGEDYELLLTSPDDLSRFGAQPIGEVTADRGILLRSGTDLTPLASRGWEHSL